MFVTSSAIQNGAFEDKYGKRGTQFSPNGSQPTLFHLKFTMPLKALNPLRLS
jgi:raw score 10.33